NLEEGVPVRLLFRNYSIISISRPIVKIVRKSPQCEKTFATGTRLGTDSYNIVNLKRAACSLVCDTLTYTSPLLGREP
ncbi:MAG: hypothetical protein AB1352_00335, partial [Patescibacteria group bacterium]